MESLGQKLREAREQLNYSMEQVARDTHISKNHLKALETENFSAIPGETYVIGFLRNYAEYLSLNPEALVTLYKNMKIQEQPLPMNELLEGQNKKSPSLRFFLVLFLVLILGSGGFLLYRFSFSPAGEAENGSKPATLPLSSEAEYLFQEEFLTRWFNLEDIVKVPLNGRTYALQLKSIEDKLILKIPGGTIELNIGEERQLDLNGDSRIDIRLLLNDLDPAGLEKRANLGLYKLTRGAPTRMAEAGREAQETAEASSARAGSEAVVSAAEEALPEGGLPAGPAPEPASAVLTAESPAPFRVSITFRGYCLFRYMLKDGDREERFFHRGENFSLDVKNEVTLWISNAGALRVMIAGRNVKMGKPGEVTTKVIRWIKNEESNDFVLEVAAVD